MCTHPSGHRNHKLNKNEKLQQKATEKSHKSEKKGQKNQQFVLADQKDINIQQRAVLVLHKHTILRNCRLEVSLIYLCVSERKTLVM